MHVGMVGHELMHDRHVGILASRWWVMECQGWDAVDRIFHADLDPAP